MVVSDILRGALRIFQLRKKRLGLASGLLRQHSNRLNCVQSEALMIVAVFLIEDNVNWPYKHNIRNYVTI